MNTFWTDLILMLRRLSLMLVIGIGLNQPAFASDHPVCCGQIVHNNDKSNRQSPLKPRSQTQEFKGLQKYVDYLINTEVARHNLPGVAVSIVKGEKIVLLKGYGFADLSRKIKVDPNDTLFRIASITKTMTAIAVMQLVEQGKLEIDADINDYLSAFKIPNTFNDPITIRALLSHRAGFEQADAGNLFVQNPLEVVNTEQYLATHMPQRVWPPGHLVSYSNYGFALLGYLVELQSGMSLETYMDQAIFSPLDMSYTTLREPIKNNTAFTSMQSVLENHLATGYFRNTKDQNIAKPFEFTGHIAGAGAASSTAHDMALYMRALMSNNNRLVNPNTHEQMKQRLYNDRPLATGITHGLFHGVFKGYQQRHHAGGTHTFSSNMVMFPELQLGIFISTNAVEPQSQLVTSLATAIVNKYYRHQSTNPTAGLKAEKQAQPHSYSQFLSEQITQRHLEDYTGTYLTTRRSYTQLEKLSALNGSTTISINKQGELIMNNSGHTIKLKRLKENVFQGASKAAPVFYFYQDDSGNIDRFSASMYSGDYERVAFLQSPLCFYLALALASLLSMSTLLLSAMRRFKSNTLSKAELLACCSAGMILAAVLGFIFMNVVLAVDDYDFLVNFPTIEVKLLLSLLIVIALTTLAKMICLPVISRLSCLPLFYKIHYWLFSLSCLSFIYVFWIWNAIGFNYFT
ncbi:serine hydrolase [Pseudoalteromonas citrea]|uniref:Serine hydrolase n=1 Tax=Pseudoalteromonas citrea TaxID=43655 RepID=A0A5S3XNV3_9GAMM|nr:serine hydrolase domain-containing protein [Pseudoalteromonas citrea]TMP39060.1 serine hydrolase [Pseudoalteromonas citrea]TMP57113.1 serine hydrolase [Pseudoalteromonas citrea]